MIKSISLSANDIEEINRIAMEQDKRATIQISQNNINISARSILGYHILDFSKLMNLIVYDYDTENIINKFSKWFVDST